MKGVKFVSKCSNILANYSRNKNNFLIQNTCLILFYIETEI